MPESVTDKEFVRVCPLEELAGKRMVVAHGPCGPLVVVHEQGRVFALDNRCPHMGFPLHRGSVENGILTCHWHHARFDLASGGTFDPWADDVPTAPVEVRDGVVWVGVQPGYADGAAHWHSRLREGLEQKIPLVLAKAVLGLGADGVSDQEIVREAALFGARARDDWSGSLTILTALTNLLPALPEEERYLALYQGLRHVAEDCAGTPARRSRQPLPADGARDLATLGRWLRDWIRVRHRDGAERTLLTAIAGGAVQGKVALLLLEAVSDRYFADGGHALDFINKGFELLDHIGWEHAAKVLPALVGPLVEARGAEESDSWRHPVDLIPLCEAVFAELPALLAAGAPRRGSWSAHASLADALLGDDPVGIVGALKAALREGARGADLSRALAYAAALRVARFGTANEHSDWDTAHHAFTYCNALHQLLKRIEKDTPDALRGIFHGAMRLWLIRFLNVPPVRLPEEDSLDDLPSDAAQIRDAFLSALDRQGAVKEAARLVARTLALGHPGDALVATLARAMLREDAGFHTFQMLEAGVRQWREWGDTPEGRRILVAVARWLAAHSPTPRAQLQTADVARRLARGQNVYEEES
ncbi:MAG: Rieske (2Fe-2S) protein [Burkholderiales bacterium]|nr:Rieske (2Fe-2S) protein [Burkholderiales bacterium]